MLIVTENLVNFLAMFANIGGKSFPSAMAAKNHEDVLMFLDTCLPPHTRGRVGHPRKIAFPLCIVHDNFEQNTNITSDRVALNEGLSVE